METASQLLSVLDENEWLLYHGETAPVSIWREGSMDFRASLDMLKRKIPAPAENQAPSHLSHSQSSQRVILARKVTQFKYITLHVWHSNIMCDIHWLDWKMKFMSVLITDNLKMTQNIILINARKSINQSFYTTFIKQCIEQFQMPWMWHNDFLSKFLQINNIPDIITKQNM